MLNPVTLLLLFCAGLAIATPASASIFQMDLEGIVDVNHINPGATGGAVNFSIIFDLDESNADSFEILNPASEPEFPRWTFQGPPYQLSAAGPIGSFFESTLVEETFDNFDSAAEGLPYGIVDGFLMQGSQVTVDCSNGVIDPVTGCSDPDAPPLSGAELAVYLLADPTWLSGYMLPTYIPAFDDLLAVRGYGEFYNNGQKLLDVEYSFHAMTVTQVPTPASIALVAFGLLGIARVQRNFNAVKN